MKKKNRFLANKTFVVFSILAVCIILTAVFAPVVTRGVDPLKGSLVDALLPPCKEHIFGTDKMGRDIFSRVIYGARASLSATFGVVALIFLVGTVTGVLAGYFGGVIDAVIMRIAFLILAPIIPATARASTSPGKASIISAIRIITASTIPPK